MKLWFVGLLAVTSASSGWGAPRVPPTHANLPYGPLVTKEDAPVYLYYPGSVSAKGVAQKDPVHSANSGALLAEKLAALGLDYEFVHRGVTEPRHKNLADYFIHRLKQ